MPRKKSTTPSTEASAPAPVQEPVKEVPQHYERLPIDRIAVSGANPRKDFNQEDLEELKASIREHGILEPLIVRPIGPRDCSRYELVAGERRLRAAKDLGLLEVPCVIKDLDDRSARQIMLIENLQRADLQPLEVAHALEELLKDGITQDDLAKKLGRSQGWISNSLRLLKAPEDLQKLLISREITPKHAQVLLTYSGFPAVYDAAMKQYEWEAKEGGVSVSRLGEIMQGVIGNDYHGERCLNFTNPGWAHKDLLVWMDKEACKECGSRVEVELGRKKNLVCLKPECFKGKLKAAEEIKNKNRNDEKKEMLEGKRPVNMDLLSYSEYDRLSYAKFDISDCKDCKSCRKDKTGSDICLDPKCYMKKQHEKSKAEDKAKKDKRQLAFDAANAYVVTKTGSLNDRELRLILETIAEHYDFQEADCFAPWVEGLEDLEFDEFKELTDAVPDEDLPKAILAVFLQHIADNYDTDHLQLIKDIGDLGKPSEHVVKVPKLPESEEDEEEAPESPGKVKGYQCPDSDDDTVYGTLPAAKEAEGCEECPAFLDGDCDGPSKVYETANEEVGSEEEKDGIEGEEVREE